MRLWILFKPSVLIGFLWQSFSRERKVAASLLPGESRSSGFSHSLCRHSRGWPCNYWKVVKVLTHHDDASADTTPVRSGRIPHYCLFGMKVQNPLMVPSNTAGREVVGLITVWWGCKSQLTIHPSLTPPWLGWEGASLQPHKKESLGFPLCLFRHGWKWGHRFFFCGVWREQSG